MKDKLFCLFLLITLSSEAGVLYQFSGIVVKEDGPERCLIFEAGPRNFVRQTCIYPKNPNYLIFNYQKVFLGSLLLEPNPKSALMVGLGGGSFPNSLIQIFPNLDFDIVEISPTVYEVAKKYFNFTPSKTTHVHIEDGVGFVSKSVKKYDLIFLDAFSAKDVAPEFLDKDFFQSLRNISNGVVVCNTFVRSKYFKKIDQLFKTFFKNAYSITLAGNRIIIASNHSIDLANLDKGPWDKVFEEHGVDPSWILNLYEKAKPLSFR
ncbi:Putative spermidine synthase [Candidatus Phycorickettsia trachydisci]|uniref:Spermidine synthase n=1 Tax=Candidatus Phycorickettsia trachydisci TaxID=2115978 RepID=A0A2P1P8L5_9RICK|nr:MnmC family methyltransferase [Candidatus Phycorickettsia trachydisci]AVP87601.1 Putative spermidine synthase [Candidatus Phycorickettsia trachydisci]